MSIAPFARLASTPPGAELGALLAVLQPRDASDQELGDLLAAEARQLAHHQARVWSAMAELADRDPMVNAVSERRWTRDEMFESAVDEIRAELRLTRRAARRELEHAVGVTSLPRVVGALAAGDIDRTKAIALADGCLGLTDPQIDKLLDTVLPEAAKVTATGLADRIRKVALALDPRWAEHRYQQSLRERRLVSYLNDDGTATISGQCLPADQAAAACARVDALAKAAKRTGASAPTDHLRTELFLGLLDGRFQGRSESDIVAELVRQFPKPADEAVESQPVEPPPLPADRTATPGEQPRAARRAVELRVRLGTLLGSNDEPAEIAGWGPIPASVARRMAAQQQKSEWRFAIVDDAGRLLFDGVTRRRPRLEFDEEQLTGGIVELQVPLAMVTDPGLAATHPQWAGVLTDLAAQFAEQHPIEQDPDARFAGRPLRRRTQIKFRDCLFAGCRRPASECDLDHRNEHSRGGRTDEWNSGPGCRHDHQLKTTGGWRLVRRDEVTFVWISPLGRRHVVEVEPIAPVLPAPIPRALPPQRWSPDDDPDPPPTFQPRTQRGRPLAAQASTEPPAAHRAVGAAVDAPPF